jgi:hypothetical protein
MLWQTRLDVRYAVTRNRQTFSLDLICKRIFLGTRKGPEYFYLWWSKRAGVKNFVDLRFIQDPNVRRQNFIVMG